MSLEGSVQITGYLGPTSSGDTYPTHVDIYGQGGLRIVEDIIERNNIPFFRRKEKMIVGIKTTNDFWRLDNNPSGDTTNNSDWGIWYPSSGFTDTFVSATTFDNNTYKLSFQSNDGTTWEEDLAVLASDIYVMSGVYEPSGGTVTYTTNSGNTFVVSGFTTGMTDTFVTGGTLNGMSLELQRNIGNVNPIDLTSIGNLYWTSGSSGTHSIRTIGNKLTGGDSTGNNSTSSGYHTIASGKNSTASGYYTIADGRGATASGYYSHASGYASHAEGQNTTASGTTSFIHSTNSIVTGDRSVVLGGQNITGDTADTVYVPKLNVGTVLSNQPVNNLGIDSDGFVVVATESVIGSYGHTFFVAPDGDDATGEIGNINKPYKTINKARGDADFVTKNSGFTDTLVYVWPGTYMVEESQYENGTFYFSPGSEIHPIPRAESEVAPMFNIGATNLVHEPNTYTATTCDIYGYVDIYIDRTTDNDWSRGIWIINNGTSYIECGNLFIDRGIGVYSDNNSTLVFRGDSIYVTSQGYIATTRGSSNTVFDFKYVDYRGSSDCFFVRYSSTQFNGSCQVSFDKLDLYNGHALQCQQITNGAKVNVNIKKIDSYGTTPIYRHIQSNGDYSVDFNASVVSNSLLFEAFSNTGGRVTLNGKTVNNTTNIFTEWSNTTGFTINSNLNSFLNIPSGTTGTHNTFSVASASVNLNGKIYAKNIDTTATTITNGIVYNGGDLTIGYLDVEVNGESITTTNPNQLLKLDGLLGSNGIINSGITISDMTTGHTGNLNVKKLNISDVGSGTSINNLGIDSDGFVVIGSSGGIITTNKYVTTSAFTANTPLTITHSLNDEDVIVQVKNNGELVIPETIDNYTVNSVDITVSTTDNYKIIIIK